MADMRHSIVPRLIGGAVEPMVGGQLIGITGENLQRLRLSIVVSEGDHVRMGDLLLSDRKRPWITVVSPVEGRVSKLELGPRRGIAALEITPGTGNDARLFEVTSVTSREGLTALMVAAGLWSALRSRPFGRIPDPAQRVDALFVTLTAGRSGAPDPLVAISGLTGWFERGLAALPFLTSGPVYLCHPREFSAPNLPTVKPVAFRTGLPSAHIHTLHPVAFGGNAWQIGWQDVVALGHLIETGRIWSSRIVALSGKAVARPGLILAPIGARLHDIAAGRLNRMSLRLLAGGETGQAQTFLRPSIDQIAAVSHRDSRAGGRLRRLSVSLRSALIPNAWDERQAPPGILPVPLLRALASGDTEKARDLGALGLIEEDLADLSQSLDGNADYRMLLRQTLDELEDMA